MKNPSTGAGIPTTPYDTVCVSGGFDPIHVGHIRMIHEASGHGQVIVIVNSDEWLMRKKGYIFMPFKERCEILRAIKGVQDTVMVDDTDETVCEALKRIKPTYFANGGDRKTHNTPEMEVCQKEGIQLLWNIGGGKIQSSSELVTDAGMVKKMPVLSVEGELDIVPSRVVILTSSEVSDKSEW